MITSEDNDGEPTPSVTDSTEKHVEESTDIYKFLIVLQLKRKQEKNTEEESPMLEKAFQILNETSTSTDLYFTYGQHIANELRKYDQRTLIYVKNAINNVIYEADLGFYTLLGHAYYSNTTQNSTLSPQPPVRFPHHFRLLRLQFRLLSHKFNFLYNHLQAPLSKKIWNGF